MIRIAIVDDINAFCSQLDGYLNRSANSKGIKLDVSTYYTAERFCEDEAWRRFRPAFYGYRAW